MEPAVRNPCYLGHAGSYNRGTDDLQTQIQVKSD